MLKYNLALLKNAIMDFNRITGILIVLYDGDFNVICSYPTMNELCREIRRSPSLTEHCLACDSFGLNACKRSGERVVYKCHLGLTEAVAPIKDGEDIIGYLMLGQQILPGDVSRVRKNILSLPHDDAQDTSALLCALDSLVPLPAEKLESAAKIMEMCACYLCANRIVRKEENERREAINNYIMENLASSELSMHTVARKFSVSRSTLYSMCLEFFGMGISDYIRQSRIDRSKELLLRTDLPIYEIALKCGFGAANHFTKTFKAAVGMLPKEYRKSVVSGKAEF